MDTLLGNLSEYDNVGGLLTGMEGSDDELIGALDARPAEVQRNVIERIRNYRPSGQTKARAEFEARLAMLPARIRKGLASGAIQLFDTTLYNTRQVSETAIEIFKNDDAKRVGVCNISRQQLDKDVVFLLFGVQVLYSQALTLAGAGNNQPFLALDHPSYLATPTDVVAALQRSEMSLRVNSKLFFDELPVANTLHNSQLEQLPGFLRLDNPKVIPDQVDIKLTLKLAENIPLPSTGQGFVQVKLHGISTRQF